MFEGERPAGLFDCGLEAKYKSMSVCVENPAPTLCPSHRHGFSLRAVFFGLNERKIDFEKGMTFNLYLEERSMK